MKITYFGHGCLGIETNNKYILVDPFITGNPLAKHIDVEAIVTDYILITHAHQDHILDVETIAKNNPNVILISNWEIVTYFEKKGIKGHPINTGGKWNFDFGTIYCTLAHHSSSFPDGTYGGNPNGYVIKNSQKTLYVAGDTCLFSDMKLLPEIIGKIDVCVLPIGDNFTMDYTQAALAANFIECSEVIAYHYDTFGFIEVNHKEVEQYFQSKHKKIHLIPIGESISI